ncbi:MAG: hypothetical protein ACFB10_25595 [Salibacteraceae bacterium]
MDSPDIFFVSEFSDIPPVFHSDLTQAPFENCVLCEQFLLKDGTPYVIEKAFKRNLKLQITNTLFEYAICMDCVEKMREVISKESAIAMEKYMAERVDLAKRRQELIAAKDFTIESWLGKCIITEKPMETLSEYQISCQCDGSSMLYTFLPYMISEEAILELVENISEKTKDELDGFRDTFLGPSPEIQDLLPDRPLVLI